MIVPVNNCTGCSLCYSICPVSAISMKPDSKGFYLPSVDAQKCIKCEICYKNCPRIKQTVEEKRPLSSVALQMKDETRRRKSTSGGAFQVLADFIRKKNGYVAGVIFDKNHKAIHTLSNEANIIEQMSGSKYVESDMGRVIYDVAECLKKGNPVLFSGTPCQVDAVIKYMDIKSIAADNLFTCQIVCHGTPSPLVFEDHLKHIEIRRKKRIKKYICRYKKYGWHEHNETVFFEDNTIESQSKITQNHKDLFYSGYSLRESCFVCDYAGKCGNADFMIGDFWGIEKIKPEIDDNKGTSILLVNSCKAKRLINSLSNKDIVLVDIPIEQSLQYNHNKPSQKPSEYNQFWDDYLVMSFSDIVRKYAKDRMPNNIVYYLKKWIRRFLVKLHIVNY